MNAKEATFHFHQMLSKNTLTESTCSWFESTLIRLLANFLAICILILFVLFTTTLVSRIKRFNKIFNFVFKKCTGIPVSWVFIAPGVSPKKPGGSPNNPAIRLYKFNTETGVILDYMQYYLDLLVSKN